MNYIKSIKTVGWKKTFEHLYMFRQIKEGKYIGQDELGNKYYENLSLPYGQHRWVEPKNYDVGSLIEATNIAPQWHRWLHYSTDDVPVTSWKKEFDPTKNATGETNVIFDQSDTPIKHHYNQETLLKARPNPALKRERGYSVGSYYSQPFENGFYTQPGHPLNPYHKDYKLQRQESSWNPNGDSNNTASASTSTSNITEFTPAWKILLEKRKQMTLKEESDNIASGSSGSSGSTKKGN